MLSYNKLEISTIIDNGSEVHRHQCIDELEGRISTALKEIYYLWSLHNLSCTSIAEALKARSVDLNRIAEELENFAHALKEKFNLPKEE